MMEPVRSHFLWRPQLRDPNDELVLEAASFGGGKSGHARMLVTFNARDFVGAERFGIEVVPPREALKRLTE